MELAGPAREHDVARQTGEVTYVEDIVVGDVEEVPDSVPVSDEPELQDAVRRATNKTAEIHLMREALHTGLRPRRP